MPRDGLPPGDFNLPPGVRSSDLPGNRPHDEDPITCPKCGYLIPFLAFEENGHASCPCCGEEVEGL